jgi:phenylpyruvate tautomerase PptA (4-oxalocrotonate tautomerase family)
MPPVMIYQSPRPPKLRATAIRSVTDALVGSHRLQPDEIHVSFHEVPDHRWGRGGVPACDRAAGSTP